MKAKPKKTIAVRKAQVIEAFVLSVEFTDGKRTRVDIGPFLTKSKLPDIAKYRNAKQFARCEIVGGNVIWGDYEMLFPVAELYAGSIHVP